MTEPTYYTPLPGDLHVGYECEMSLMSSLGWVMLDLSKPEEPAELIKFPKPIQHWCHSVVVEKEDPLSAGSSREISVFLDALADNRLRTRYLNKSDIEACGWIYQEKYNNFIRTKEDAYILTWWDITKKWCLSNYHEPQYLGEIKSINELRKLQMWLKIPTTN